MTGRTALALLFVCMLCGRAQAHGPEQWIADENLHDPMGLRATAEQANKKQRERIASCHRFFSTWRERRELTDPIYGSTASRSTSTHDESQTSATAGILL